MSAGADVKAVATDRRYALYIGTIYGDLKIRTHDSATMQMDIVSWLSRNNLLAELQDKGSAVAAADRR